MEQLLRIRVSLKDVGTEEDLLTVGHTADDVLMRLNKLSSSSDVLASASFNNLHNLVQLTLKVADDFTLQQQQVGGHQIVCTTNLPRYLHNKSFSCSIIIRNHLKCDKIENLNSNF